MGRITMETDIWAYLLGIFQIRLGEDSKPKYLEMCKISKWKKQQK